MIVVAESEGRTGRIKPKTTTPKSKGYHTEANYAGIWTKCIFLVLLHFFGRPCTTTIADRGGVAALVLSASTSRTTPPTLLRLAFAGSGTADKSSLTPEENPHADLTRSSKSGVRYSDVMDCLHDLFPPRELESRNALSRSDGYWSYIKEGKEPPPALTYGEFDFYFFAEILDVASELFIHNDDGSSSSSNHEQQHPGSASGSTSTATTTVGWCGGGWDPNVAAATATAAKSTLPPSSTTMMRSTCNGWEDKIFVDIGSGAGRLVFAAAALHPGWRECRGIELLPGLHEKATESSRKCCQNGGTHRLAKTNDVEPDLQLNLAPISFQCGSFEDPSNYFGDANCIFVTATCLPKELLGSLRECVLRQCSPGTVVISTDYPLTEDHTGGSSVTESAATQSYPSRYQLHVIKKIEGWSWVTGGGSTAYIHRVNAS